MLAGKVFNRQRSAAVGVAFAQHRVDGTAQASGVARQRGFVGVGFRVFRQVGQLVAVGLQFANGFGHLVHRGADVGQLDDVGVRQQGQPAELRQVVGHFLLGCQDIGKLTQNAGSQRNVTLNNINAGWCSKGAQDRQERTGGQVRRLIGQCVNNF